MKFSIDILIPELRSGDAIGNHTLLLQRLLQARGLRCRIIVERVVERHLDVTTMDQWHNRSDMIILQHGIGSQLTAAVIEEQIPIILNYHNITPPHLTDEWHQAINLGTRWGLQQLNELRSLSYRTIADSQFNADELTNLQFSDVHVVPVLADLSRFRELVQMKESGSPPATGGTLLFVGRVVPNKRQHLLIAMLAILLKIRPDAQLTLVGDSDASSYPSSLRSLISVLNLDDRVAITGRLADSSLLDRYRSADVFVCASEHEGFCVPLAESMACGLPVVAFGSTAIPGTVGTGGILLSRTNPTELAVAVDQVLRDPVLRLDLVHKGSIRSQELDFPATSQLMWTALADLV